MAYGLSSKMFATECWWTHSLAANVKALALWRYSVFRLPGAAAD
jgi:hypothetical protein